MKQYSTREVAKKLGLDIRSIQRYLAKGKIPAPPTQRIGGGKFRVWTDEDIERVRKILPKIANGRKTRYQKKHPRQAGAGSAVSTHGTPGRAQQSAKAKKKNE